MSKVLKIFSQNKKSLFLIMGIGIFISLIPFFFANAVEPTPAGFCTGCGPLPWEWPVCIKCLLEYVFSLPFRIPFFVLVLVIGVVALICGLFLGLATALLAWAVEIFMSVPIISAPVVIAGWTFSRDFANMFFILALVFIGLSTILRIREYEAKKALPILIIIAILINFTPVIIGFIVDMSNIVTDFFLQDVGGLSSIGDKTSAALEYLGESIRDVFLIDGSFFEHFLLPYEVGGQQHPSILVHFTSLMIYGLVLIAYFLLAALIYLLIVMVFFIRIIILWILAILAPIAFLSKIFPATKETKLIFPSILHWDEWWEKLIQWSIVGIPIGFFLYLSNYVLLLDIDTLFGTGAAGGLSTQLAGQGQPGITGAFATMFLSLLSPVVALVLLLWGANISLQAAPAGARGIVNFAKKGGKWISSRRPVRLAMGAAAGRAAGLIGGAARRARDLEARAGRLPGGKVWSKMVKPATWMTRGAEMGAVPALRKYESKARRVSYDEMFKGMEAGEMAQTIEALSTKKDRVEAAAWMAEKGLSDKPGVTDAFKKKMVGEAHDLAKDPHYQKSVGDLLESYTRGVTAKVILDLDPAKAKELNEKVEKIKEEMKDEKIKLEIEAEAKTRGVDIETEIKDVAAKEIWIGGLKAGDVKDIEKKSFREDIGTRRGMRAWGSSHMSSLQNNFKKDVIDDALNNSGGLNAMFEGKTDEEAKPILEKLYQENPRIINFLNNTPAGREWNWKGRQFLPKNKDGRPDFGAFVEKMEAKQGGLLGSDTEFKDNIEKLATETNVKTLEREAEKFEKERAEKAKEFLKIDDDIEEEAKNKGVSLSHFAPQRMAERRKHFPDLQEKYESLEKELTEVAGRKKEMSHRAEELKTILTKREDEVKITKAPSPLPETEEGMPKTLRDSIKKGQRSIKNIEKTQKELQRSRELIKDLEKHRAGLSQEIGKVNEAIKNLDDKEVSAPLTRDETTQRTELRGELSAITDTFAGLESRIEAQRESGKLITEKILRDKSDLETFSREPVQDLMEEWKAKEEPKKTVKEIRETYKKMRKK